MRRTKDITKQCKYKNCKYKHLPYKRFCQKHMEISTSQYLKPKQEAIAQKRRDYLANMPEQDLVKEIDTRINESNAYQEELRGEAGFTILKYDSGRPWTLWERIKAFIFINP